MERVTFLIEQTGEQLACLLNPESLVLRREAGVRGRESTAGQLTGAGLTDRPLLFTGGGTTEVELDLLFDVSLAGSSISTRNVRDLTGPLWALAENRAETDYGRPPLVRFIWGKTFNLPGIVVGVAERLERFTSEGIPARSWLRMRFARVDEEALDRDRSDRAASPASMREAAAEAPPGDGDRHTVTGGEQGASPAGEGTGPSIETVSDIMKSAFSRTGAAGMLGSAQAAVSEAAATLSEAASQLPAADDETGAADRLRAAAETFGRALETAAQGVKNGSLKAVGTAVDQLFSAAASASRVSETHPDAAGPVGRALDAVGPAAETLLTAAQTVAREVVQTSARVIATAVATTDHTIDRLSPFVERLGSASSRAARQAGSTLQSGLDRATEALERIRATGEIEAVALFPEAVRQISRAADRLWSAGTGAVAEHVSAAIEEMAVRLKNLKAAAGALGSVTEHALSDVLRSAVETLRTTGTAARESEDLSELSGASTQLRAVMQSVRSVGPDAAAEAREKGWDAVRSVDAIVEEVLDSGEPERLSALADLLPALEETAQALEAAEQEETADAISTAVRAREESAPADRDAPDAGGDAAGSASRRPQGERLDQIAFRHYGNPAYWRLLALHNDIDHPLRLPAGRQLALPSARPSGP